VNPWYFDAYGQTTRAFITLAVPSLPGSSGALFPPYCVAKTIGQVRGAPLFPSPANFAVDDGGTSAPLATNPVVYAAAVTGWGIRILGVSVPAGRLVLDLTLPCDTGVCADSLSFLAVRNGTAVTGGALP
jgi:hypothetical protein